MNKVTKAGVAGLMTLALAGGATAAFASPGSSPDPAKSAKVDVTREHKTFERKHDTSKDRSTDRSGKDTYKESWDRKDGSNDGPGDPRTTRASTDPDVA